MDNEINEVMSIRFKPSLMEKVEDYLKLVNSVKSRDDPVLTKAKFFNDLVSNYFEDTILSNEYIVLEKPLYFNYNNLLQKGRVKCSLTKPTNLDDVCIVKRVPNNIDKINKFDSKLTYCHEKQFTHEGILFSVENFSLDSDSLIMYYLVFDLNLTNSKEPELTIRILKPNNLTDFLDIEEDKDLINELISTKSKCEDDNKKFVDLYLENKDKLDGEYEDIPKNIMEEIINAGYGLISWQIFNYDSFVPVKFYSRIQQLLILFKNASNKESKEIEETLKFSEYELELYFNTFEKWDDDSRFVHLFINLDDESHALDFENIVNGFLNEEEIGVLIKNNFGKNMGK